MNNKKICFIICVNDELYLQECLYYIGLLFIPQEYEIDVLTIMDANSMTEGYNEGMYATDAMYKIYMHQDVFIVNRNFLKDMLKVFQDKTIGMLGMVGAPKFPGHGIMWYGERVGSIYTCNVVEASLSVLGSVEEGDAQDVEAVDGLLIATQYDVPWRDDIFRGWDFYDVSQSFEFRRKGYRVVVPKMEKAWCIHDDGFLNLNNYFEERKKFFDEYIS